MKLSCAFGHSEGHGRAAVLGVLNCTAPAGVVSPGVLVSGGCCTPSRQSFYQLRVQLLQKKRNCCPHLSASRSPLPAAAACREAKPSVSSAASPWARFLPPPSCIQLLLVAVFAQQKQKKTSGLTSCLLKPKSCTHNETCTRLSHSQSQHGRNQMVDIKMSPAGAVPELFFRGPFVPSQPAHFCTYLPGVPLIPLSAQTPYYLGSEQFHLPWCHSSLTRRMLSLLNLAKNCQTSRLKTACLPQQLHQLHVSKQLYYSS